jgi:hypothetical protein
MGKSSIFFERIVQILEYYDINSVNSFALDYLKYNSSEKINRLKKPNTNPSFDILCDIANKFEEIDMNWLLLGVGKMLKDDTVDLKSSISSDLKIVDQVSFNYLLDRYEKLAIENGRLNAELDVLKRGVEKS